MLYLLVLIFLLSSTSASNCCLNNCTSFCGLCFLMFYVFSSCSFSQLSSCFLSCATLDRALGVRQLNTRLNTGYIVYSLTFILVLIYSLVLSALHKIPRSFSPTVLFLIHYFNSPLPTPSYCLAPDWPSLIFSAAEI